MHSAHIFTIPSVGGNILEYRFPLPFFQTKHSRNDRHKFRPAHRLIRFKCTIWVAVHKPLLRQPLNGIRRPMALHILEGAVARWLLWFWFLIRLLSGA